MKKSIIIFMTVAVFSIGVTAYGWYFVDSQIGEVTLTEETIAGNRDVADGLTVGFRADSADSLHWTQSFDYSTDKTKSTFYRGEMAKKADTSVYDKIRFNGWSGTPYFTQLQYDLLEGTQDNKIQAYYEKIQQAVVDKGVNSGTKVKGKIKVKDYLDYYPISFKFQFGRKIYDLESSLTGLKIYDVKDTLASKNGTVYDREAELYVALNKLFKIPVIDNEYQEYTVETVKDEKVYGLKKPKPQLNHKTEVKRPLGEGQDVYQFDPIIVHQEESSVGKTASQVNLKNRILFTVNQKTVKGAPIDVSQIRDGYGVYELPIEVTATISVRKGNKSVTLPDPQPEGDKLKMVYPLDEKAEYVEMSLSEDHRYLAIFSVKGGDYFVDMVDADTWTSKGPFKLFPASKKMTYSWGEQGTLAVTNHKGYVAVLTRTENKDQPYELLYSGKAGKDLDKAFFDTEMEHKEHSQGEYEYGIDQGLTVATKDGKVALVQSLFVGDSKFNMRNAELECVVLDKSGVIYRGRLKSNIADLGYDMSKEEFENIRDLLDSAAKGEADSKFVKDMIQPVRNENWSKW